MTVEPDRVRRWPIRQRTSAEDSNVNSARGADPHEEHNSSTSGRKIPAPRDSKVQESTRPNRSRPSAKRWTESDIAAYARSIVDSIPPLTEEQRARLALLMRGTMPAKDSRPDQT